MCCCTASVWLVCRAVATIQPSPQRCGRARLLGPVCKTVLHQLLPLLWYLSLLQTPAETFAAYTDLGLAWRSAGMASSLANKCRMHGLSTWPFYVAGLERPVWCTAVGRSQGLHLGDCKRAVGGSFDLEVVDGIRVLQKGYALGIRVALVAMNAMHLQQGHVHGPPRSTAPHNVLSLTLFLHASSSIGTGVLEVGAPFYTLIGIWDGT